VLAALRQRKWLLQADAELPSVATLVVGEPIAGSWWGHPESNRVYWVLEELDESPEILRVKLVKGKTTLVHRALWPEVIAVATSNEPWQTAKLSPAAKSLLARVRKHGTQRLDQLERWSAAKKPGEAARELESRLLVYGDELHTDSGRHTKCLESWPHLMTRLAIESALPDPADAKRALERAIPGDQPIAWRARARAESSSA
jgi:hypothetical protein